MSFDMVKFERGQVWMISYKDSCIKKGHEQLKDRPWLVLSIGKFNKSSGMITAVPITTRNEVRTPAQVLFKNTSDRKNVILCEQIKSFDCTCGDYIFDFMGNVSDEVLDKVDVALSVHLGLHYSPISLDRLYSSMEAIVKSVGYLKEKAESPVFTDDDVLNFAEKLSELATAPMIEDNEDKIIELQHSMTKEILPSSEVPSVNTPPEKKSRIRWTEPTCREFLEDNEKLPMNEVMKKWNLNKKSEIYSKKNYAKRLLKMM